MACGVYIYIYIYILVRLIVTEIMQCDIRFDFNLPEGTVFDAHLFFVSFDSLSLSLSLSL